MTEIREVLIRHERATDVAAREALLDQAFGEARWRKSSQMLREGRLPAERLAFVATEGGRLTGTARLWNVKCAPEKHALLLGPVAVAGDRRNAGIGGALVERAIASARALGHAAILLVGDAAYYQRFGFTSQKTGLLWMPGPFERDRLLGLELQQGALDGARGLIAPAGRTAPQPDLATLIAVATGQRRVGPRARTAIRAA